MAFRDGDRTGCAGPTPLPGPERSRWRWPSPWACAPTTPCALGPIFRSRLRARLWSVNHQAALLLSCEPDTVWFGKDRVDPLLDEPPAGARPARPFPERLAGGAARWNLRLEPGQTWTLETFALIPAHDRRLRWRNLDMEAGSRRPQTGRRRPGRSVRHPWALGLADPRLQTLIAALAIACPSSTMAATSPRGPSSTIINGCGTAPSWPGPTICGGSMARSPPRKPPGCAPGPAAGISAPTRESGTGPGRPSSPGRLTPSQRAPPSVLARTWRHLARGAQWIARTRRRERNPASPRAGLLPAGPLR